MKIKQIDTLPEKREIQAQYRGMQIPVKVCCIQEQVDVMLNAMLKTLACEAGLIPAVFCEDDL
eukprot:4298779-Prorocentrum_lima.AAC.1